MALTSEEGLGCLPFPWMDRSGPCSGSPTYQCSWNLLPHPAPGMESALFSRCVCRENLDKNASDWGAIWVQKSKTKSPFNLRSLDLGSPSSKWCNNLTDPVITTWNPQFPLPSDQDRRHSCRPVPGLFFFRPFRNRKSSAWRFAVELRCQESQQLKVSSLTSRPKVPKVLVLKLDRSNPPRPWCPCLCWSTLLGNVGRSFFHTANIFTAFIREFGKTISPYFGSLKS